MEDETSQLRVIKDSASALVWDEVGSDEDEQSCWRLRNLQGDRASRWIWRNENPL